MAQKRHGIEITKQSFDDRFNEFSVIFLKEFLESLLKYKITKTLHFKCNFFNRIIIKDSVCFQVDSSLSEIFPGSGGAGSKASVRIQFEFDILSGSIIDLSINAFNEQDAKNSTATLHLTQKGDLVIRDLAYMSISVLKDICKNLAFFLCRLDPKVKVFEITNDQYCKIDFIDIYKHMKKNGISILEKIIYLGNIDKLQVRLVIHLMPAIEVAKRLRKANANRKKKSRGNLTKEFIIRAHLNLFITNTSPEQLHTEKAWELYRLRWQIELIFKTWKSFCNIDKVKKVKRFRLECYMYSRLILIVLAWQLILTTAKLLYKKEEKILSLMKAFKTMYRQKIEELRTVLILEKESLHSFFSSFYNLSRKNNLLEKKQQSPHSIEILLNYLSRCGTI